jgi:hypothetical protein
VIAAPPRELGLRNLVLCNIAAVVSIRWLATAAHIGPLSLLLWTGAALLFFLPLALSVATLTARFSMAIVDKYLMLSVQVARVGVGYARSSATYFAVARKQPAAGQTRGSSLHSVPPVPRLHTHG